MGPGLLRMHPECDKDSQDAPRMAPGLFRMGQDGRRIVLDASRMS